MTRKERKDAIGNLNMIRVAFIDTVTPEQGRLIDDTFRTAIKALEQDCENKKYGKWIEIYAKNYELPRLYRCSECEMIEMEYPSTIYEHFRYCPNCGARMKKLQEGGNKE